MVTGSSKAWLGGFGEIANFQSVSDGKALVASAITDKGVQTASDATFQTMAKNIAEIANGVNLDVISNGRTQYLIEGNNQLYPTSIFIYLRLESGGNLTYMIFTSIRKMFRYFIPNMGSHQITYETISDVYWLEVSAGSSTRIDFNNNIIVQSGSMASLLRIYY